MTLKIRATMIPVASLEAGIKRYTEAFGLELRRRVMDAEYGGSIGTNIAVLTGTIEVWLLDRGITPAEYPALFFETEDIGAVRERIEQAGFRVAPWKGQEINDDPLGRYYVFEDADGNQIEVREPEHPWKAAGNPSVDQEGLVE